MSELLQQAFRGLYPKREMPELEISYSGRFKEYNANVQIKKNAWSTKKLIFNLSKKFLDTSEDMQIGIIQHLLNKVYKTKVKSMEQDIYNNFLKHLSTYSTRIKSDPYLITVYNELNEEYFDGLLDQPNLVFGQESLTVLGHYSYPSDKVTISTALKEDDHLLKFVLYHELLHKKHGFKKVGSKTMYHTREFKLDEKKFSDKDVEKKLNNFVKKKKFKGWF